MSVLNLHTGQRVDAPPINHDNPQLSTGKIAALEELKQLNQWLVWSDEQRGAERTKVPYNAGQALRGFQRGASTTDPATWSLFTTTARALTENRTKYSGVGFVFRAGGGLTGIDVDNCLSANGTLLEWARGIVEPLFAIGAYAEVSPSKRGLKFFVRGTVPHPRGEGLSFTIRDENGQKLGKIEIYSQERFFTVTGKRYHLAGTALVDAQAEITALYTTYKTAGAESNPVALHLPDVARIDARALLGKDGMPFRLTSGAYTRRILANAMARMSFTKAGSSDEDWSVIRWIVCKGLVLAGYEDDEIAALMWHFEGILNGSKRTRDFLADVARTIAKWRAKYPHIIAERTRVRRSVDAETVAARLQLVDEPRKSRARKDRPQAVAGTEGYLDWLREHADTQSGAVMLSLSEAAEQLKISRRTIARYEQTLRESGKIERRAFASRQAGCVFVLEAFRRGDNIPEKATPAASETVVTTAEPEGIATRNNGNVEPEKEHAAIAPPPQASAAQRVASSARVPSSPPASDGPPAEPDAPRSLAELVSEAIDCYGTGYGFGKEKPVKRVRVYVAANGGERFTAFQIDREYRAELKRRASEREAQRLAELDLKELIRKRKQAASHIRLGLKPQRDPKDNRPDAAARYEEKLQIWRKNRRTLPMWQNRHAQLCELIAAKRAGQNPAQAEAAELELSFLALVDAPQASAEPLPTSRLALWDLLETLCAARGVVVPQTTFTIDELRAEVERLRRVTMTA